MKLKTIFLGTFVGLSLLAINPVKAEIPGDIRLFSQVQTTKIFNPQTPEELIQKIYQVHQPWANQEIDLEQESVLSQYFDEELTRLIIKDNECEKKSRSICNLDFDPFVEAQNYDKKVGYSNLKLRRLKSEPDAVIEVAFENIEPRKIVYQARMTEAGWRISDIVYQDGQFSLKSLLSQPIPLR
ncbi:MAG: DUF3828 domain-containing protein [Aphanocapsa sp. GSE-SYN-MK-11-07L]|jgi:hypothetical protein|nr:DUF3828 domain-containing protein [Aphanocapsa sp. GSE-SYN-MK-11-07L]